MPTDGPEKGRRQERKQIIYYLRVSDAHSGAPLGHVADLNTRGFMVTGDRPMTRGKTMLVRIELPQSMKGPRHLELKARVRWSKADAESGFHNTGFGILRPAKDDQRILSELIESFLYQEPPEDEEPQPAQP